MPEPDPPALLGPKGLKVGAPKPARLELETLPLRRRRSQLVSMVRDGLQRERKVSDPPQADVDNGREKEAGSLVRSLRSEFVATDTPSDGLESGVWRLATSNDPVTPIPTLCSACPLLEEVACCAPRCEECPSLASSMGCGKKIKKRAVPQASAKKRNENAAC